MANDTHDSSASRSASLAGDIIGKVVALLLLALVVAGAYFYLHYTTQSPKAEGGRHRPSGPPPKVAVIKVEPQTVALHPSFLGQTAAYRTVEVRARVAGFLDRRYFTEGAHVKQGQKLFQIDPSQFQQNLDAAKAQLAADKATAKRAQQQLGRYQKLVKEGAATASELENWQTQVDVAEASIQHDKAMMQQAELNLGYTTIDSRINGVIGKTLQNQGSYVSPTGNSLLAVVRQVDPIYVNYSVSEGQLLRWESMMKSGTLKVKDGKMRVSLKLADGSTYKHEGTVDFVGVTVDPSTGTADMRAKVPNPDDVLRPGQYVQVKVIGIDQSHTLVVPQSVVQDDPTGAVVYVIDKNNKIQARPVTPGDLDGKDWIIKSGLKAGDLVLASHLMTVHPGMKVKPQIQTQALASNKPATQPAADDSHS